MLLTLEGHLFDSGLINKIVDVVELQGALLEFQDCTFPPRSAHERMKSMATLKVAAQDEESLVLMEIKIQALIDSIDKAEASMFRIERRAAGADLGCEGTQED